jgi:hypothetical protein
MQILQIRNSSCISCASLYPLPVVAEDGEADDLKDILILLRL